MNRPPSNAFDDRPTVTVDAPARVHLGFLDPSGSLGRRFASLGLVIDGFSTRIGLRPEKHNRIVVAQGCSDDAGPRLERHLVQLQRETGLYEPLRVNVLRTPPVHAGFGSGTQLALAFGRAFCRMHGLDLPTPRLAALLGRGERSGVGIAGFDQGGLLLDCGPGPDGAPAPLLSRIAFPGDWRVVLILDDRIAGLCGTEERVAMDALPPFPRALAADLCHQVLMRVLPGAQERAFEPFAEGVSAIQRLIGDYFAPAQGGSMYTSPAVARVLDWMGTHVVAGIGQSSWGPTGFAILPSAEVAATTISAVRAAGVVDPALRIVVVSGNNRGAQLALVPIAFARA